MSSLTYHVERILETEVRAIAGEIDGVDARLREVASRNDDESRIELIVLRAYRRMLESDLESLEAFARERGLLSGVIDGPQPLTQACTG